MKNFGLASYTLASREIIRFLRQRNRVMGALGQPLLLFHRWYRIHFRSINEVDALRHRVIKLFVRISLGILPAPVHATEADDGDLDVGMRYVPELHIYHFISTTSYLVKGFLGAEYRALPVFPTAVVTA